jgi:hypothetical protein
MIQKKITYKSFKSFLVKRAGKFHGHGETTSSNNTDVRLTKMKQKETCKLNKGNANGPQCVSKSTYLTVSKSISTFSFISLEFSLKA